MSLDIYRLTPRGEALANNIRPERGNTRWRVIFYLAKNGSRTKEDIMANTGATGYTLSYLRMRGIISGGEGVTV